jgi:hypothetical protein
MNTRLQGICASSKLIPLLFAASPRYFDIQGIRDAHRRYYAALQKDHSVPAPSTRQIDITVSVPPLRYRLLVTVYALAVAEHGVHYPLALRGSQNSGEFG